MKHILSFVMLLVISISLFGGTFAKVVKVEGRILTIDIGWEQGVEKGMKGKALKFVQQSTTGKKISLTVGKFIVRKVDRNSSELYLERIADDPELGQSEQVEFEKELVSPGEKSARLKQNKKKIIECIKDNKLASAIELLKESEVYKKDDKELELLRKVVVLLSDKVTVKDYIEIKAEKPGDVIIKTLWEKLKAGPLDPNLPPEKYLDAALSTGKNENGYYEVTFPDKNNHKMIYIPDKKFFIDKYEVSNAQYLQFATPLKKIKFSDPKLANYPEGCPGYPAIVSYEEAQKYCKAYGMRLPNESEWEEIAGFSKGYIYSWGNSVVDADEENGEDEKKAEKEKKKIYRANFESLDDGYIEVAPVESFPGYLSPYGAVNMSGNVSEWVDEKISKGGNFLSGPGELKITGKYNDPIYVGFRCIMEADQ